MPKMILFLILLLVTFYTHAGGLDVSREFTIPAFSATYHARKLGMKIAELTTTLQKLDNGQYLYEGRSKSTGLLSVFRKEKVYEKSLWQYRNGSIVPITFLYKQRGRRNRHIEAKFDWQKKRYTKIYQGRTSTNELPPGTLDHQLYQIALMLDGQKKLKKLQYSVLERRGIEVYQFQLEGTEVLDTNLGQLSTLKYRRQRKNSPRQTLLWIAEKFHYLPVKIQHIEKNGSKFHLEIQSVNGFSSTQK